MQGLIGKKVGMTRLFRRRRKAVAVTVIQTANNVVHQVKTLEKDGYQAVQLGFDAIAERKVTKPITRSLQEAGRRRYALSRNLRSTRPTRSCSRVRASASKFSKTSRLSTSSAFPRGAVLPAPSSAIISCAAARATANGLYREHGSIGLQHLSGACVAGSAHVGPYGKRAGDGPRISTIRDR